MVAFWTAEDREGEMVRRAVARREAMLGELGGRYKGRRDSR
jgi:hypothetical protein